MKIEERIKELQSELQQRGQNQQRLQVELNRETLEIAGLQRTIMELGRLLDIDKSEDKNINKKKQ